MSPAFRHVIKVLERLKQYFYKWEQTYELLSFIGNHKSLSEELHGRINNGYVAVLSMSEWKRERGSFDMQIELEPDAGNIYNTKAEVNYDSLTGTFWLPDRKNLRGRNFRFAFALDEKGIEFIDDSGKAEQMVGTIRRTKRWREPSLERFWYDFLEQIVDDDLPMMEHYEEELNRIEDAILSS